MKKLFAFIVSALIHLAVFAAILMVYLFYKPNEVKKQEEKLLQIKLTNYPIPQTPAKKKPLMKKKVQVKKKQVKRKPKKNRKKRKKLPKPVKKIVKKTKPKKIEKPQKVEKKPIEPKVVEKVVQEDLQQTHTNTETKATKPQKEPLPQQKYDYKKTYLTNNLQKIRTLIKENLYYPRKARRRKIEGNVKLSFELSKEGKIKDIEILSPSPQILKNASKKTLKSIEKEIEPPNEDLKITLSILYKLED